MKYKRRGTGCKNIQSLLSWERGLKYPAQKPVAVLKKVAPIVGAWIEIPMPEKEYFTDMVAPIVGAWIEIFYTEK